MSKHKASTGRGITSREYKLILASDRFADRQQGARALRDLIHLLVERLDAEIEDQEQEEVRRTYYLDTAAFQLRREGFALRVRDEDHKKRYKIALKHRTPDRYLAASKDLLSTMEKDKPKFEEDILPPFRSVFSKSNSFRLADLPKLKDLGDAEVLFPGLASLNIRKKATLETVNGFVAHEVFRELCTVRFEKDTEVSVGLSFWYHTGEDRWPLVAECAFDYETKEPGDNFPLRVVEGANQLFRALQSQPGWFNVEATTKTRYAYESLS